MLLVKLCFVFITDSVCARFFLTRILPITQNPDALAFVMGHEIAHAVAEHGRQRVSQQLLSNGAGLLFSSLFAQNP